MAGRWPFSRGAWSMFQEQVPPPGSPSGSKPELVLPASFTQLNDHVYEVCKPQDGKRPSVEIVFFHGLQLEYTDDPHINTWLSRGRTTLWLTWLLEKHVDARILTMSYDASPDRTDTRGRSDKFVICENLITCLILSRVVSIGRTGCPVILVGHCVGGLVMKQTLVEVQARLGSSVDKHEKQALKNFLNRVKGVFYYSTPHYGSWLPCTTRDLPKAPLLAGIAPLLDEAQRKNEDFRRLKNKYGWNSAAIGENREVDLGGFKGQVVQEASARGDIDTGRFYTVGANHFDVCRPESSTSGGYTFLADFIESVVEEDGRRVQEWLEEILNGLRQHGSGERVNMSRIPRLLKRLVHALRIEVPPNVQYHAAGALAGLADEGGHDVCAKIAEAPGMLEALCNALTRDDKPGFQRHAGRVLQILADKDGSGIAVKMSEIPGLLANLVHALKRADSPLIQKQAAGALAAIADKGGHNVCVKVGNATGALEVLCNALTREDSPVFQLRAGRALQILAEKGGRGIAVKMSEIPGLLANLVHALRRADSPNLQKLAVGALSAMAEKGGHAVCMKIADAPGMLVMLCNALTRDSKGVLHELCKSWQLTAAPEGLPKFGLISATQEHEVVFDSNRGSACRGE